MATKFDPQLHIIRAAGRSIDTVDRRGAQEIESARFNVFAAIESGNRSDALAWLRALRVALRSYLTENDPAGIKDEALAAAGDIQRSLEAENA